MYGLMITAKTQLSRKEFESLATAKAEEFRSTPGLVAKTYIWQGETMGGFHVFTTREAAQGYLDSAGFRDVRENPKFSDWDIRHYDVLDEASRRNGTPDRPIAGPLA